MSFGCVPPLPAGLRRLERVRLAARISLFCRSPTRSSWFASSRRSCQIATRPRAGKVLLSPSWRVPERFTSIAGKMRHASASFTGQHQFHKSLALPLNFLQNHLVHSGARVDKTGGDYGEASAFLICCVPRQRSAWDDTGRQGPSPPERATPAGAGGQVGGAPESGQAVQ